jgi:hypothetical protein
MKLEALSRLSKVYTGGGWRWGWLVRSLRDFGRVAVGCKNEFSFSREFAPTAIYQNTIPIVLPTE